MKMIEDDLKLWLMRAPLCKTIEKFPLENALKTPLVMQYYMFLKVELLVSTVMKFLTSWYLLFWELKMYAKEVPSITFP